MRSHRNYAIFIVATLMITIRPAPAQPQTAPPYSIGPTPGTSVQTIQPTSRKKGTQSTVPQWTGSVPTMGTGSAPTTGIGSAPTTGTVPAQQIALPTIPNVSLLGEPASHDPQERPAGDICQGNLLVVTGRTTSTSSSIVVPGQPNTMGLLGSATFKTLDAAIDAAKPGDRIRVDRAADVMSQHHETRGLCIFSNAKEKPKIKIHQEIFFIDTHLENLELNVEATYRFGGKSSITTMLIHGNASSQNSSVSQYLKRIFSHVSPFRTAHASPTTNEEYCGELEVTDVKVYGRQFGAAAAKLIVKNSTFEKNDVGVAGHDITIINSNIYDNDTAGVYCAGCSNTGEPSQYVCPEIPPKLHITNSVIADNSSYGVIARADGENVILNTQLVNHHSSISGIKNVPGAALILLGKPETINGKGSLALGHTLIDNNDRGISVQSPMNFTIEHSFIANSKDVGLEVLGIEDGGSGSGSELFIIETTFFRNYAHMALSDTTAQLMRNELVGIPDTSLGIVLGNGTVLTAKNERISSHAVGVYFFFPDVEANFQESTFTNNGIALYYSADNGTSEPTGGTLTANQFVDNGESITIEHGTPTIGTGKSTEANHFDAVKWCHILNRNTKATVFAQGNLWKNSSTPTIGQPEFSQDIGKYFCSGGADIVDIPNAKTEWQ